MGDYAEGDMIFELGYVIPKWKVFCDRGGGEPGDCFIFDINIDK